MPNGTGSPPGEVKYPWYGVTRDDSLEQGDFFFDLEAFVPNYPIVNIQTGASIPGQIQLYDVVVLSQSCDLVNRKNLPLSVIVCPVYSLEDSASHLASLKEPKVREEARQGKMPGNHVLAECPLTYFPFSIKVAFFHQVFTVPFSYIKAIAQTNQPRMRLLPPYREHLAQAFARFVMRVGLPLDIPNLK
jgi:hypothetical protein